MQESSVPKVTVGVTACNAEVCIGECLEDCLAQTLSGIQIIVSDDASCDDTAKICRQYAARHANIKVIQQDKNIGAFANAKAVLDAATTAYFIQRDDDDITEPRYLEVLLRMLRQNPGKQGAVSACRNRRKGKIRHLRAPEFSGDRIADMISVMQASWPVKNGLFRTAYLRDVFARLEKIFPSMVCGDSLFDLVCALDDSLISTNEVVYHWRQDVRPTRIRTPIYSRYQTLAARLAAMRALKRSSADLRIAVDRIIEEAHLPETVYQVAQKYKRKFMDKTPMPYSFRLYRKMLMILVLGRCRWFG